MPLCRHWQMEGSQLLYAAVWDWNVPADLAAAAQTPGLDAMSSQPLLTPYVPHRLGEKGPRVRE